MRDDRSYTVRIPGRLVRIALIVGVTALIVAPLTALATHSFDDVPDDNTFHEEIEWLKQSGVTVGCNPPANDLFCPDDNVTREQMAAFMERLAEYMGALDGTPAEADNAATAGTADSVVDGAITASKLGTIIERQADVDIADGNGDSVSVQCQEGEIVLSGGAQTAGVGAGAMGWSLIWSGKSDNGWTAAARNDKGSAGTLIVEAYCLQP